MLSVAIVGKPNVGKSTLFNRIINAKKSIIENVPGVTRDRIYGKGTWLTKEFEVIDTGGISLKNNDFQKEINLQVDLAIDEADVIIFVASYLNGIDENDIYIAKKLKKLAKNKHIIFVLNKSESSKSYDAINNYYQLGFNKPILISSEHGIGIGNLLDEIIKFDKNNSNISSNDAYQFCIIGRPNVGKSSLTNAILNKDRVIVSNIEGTTRDAIDSEFRYNNENYIITDTAGIRRKGKIIDAVEKWSVLRANKAIEVSKCILFMLDGSTDFNEQDEVIGGLAHAANIPTIIVVNKWDLVDKDSNTMVKKEKEIRNRFKYLSWAPIVFLSAKNKRRIDKLFEAISNIRQLVSKKISTSILNEVVLKAQMRQQSPIHKGQRLVISYVTQVQSQIPTFVIFCNNPKFLHFSYARYIENIIRESFGFDIVPITLYWKSKDARTRIRKEK